MTKKKNGFQINRTKTQKSKIIDSLKHDDYYDRELSDEKALMVEAEHLLQHLEEYDCMWMSHDEDLSSVREYYRRIKDERGLEMAVHSLCVLYEKILKVKEDLIDYLN